VRSQLWLGVTPPWREVSGHTAHRYFWTPVQRNWRTSPHLL